ncbi:HEPN domain-containing protein [candidate division KSB1 bacterium]|nr:MAG: HEPN domain-containing protein [candidate division KSB1 bacterium]
MTEDQHDLLLKAKESLRIAKTILREGSSDFAASRAYYTMFYVAEALLLQKEFSFSKHSAVIAAFYREFCKTGVVPVEFHTDLVKAQSQRHKADYDVRPHLSIADAERQIERAERFVGLGERVLGSVDEGD